MLFKKQKSVIYLQLPKQITETITQWSWSNIADKDIYVWQFGHGGGREAFPHITILYDVDPNASEQVNELNKIIDPMAITLGCLDLFTTKQHYDILTINVQSPTLKAVRQNLKGLVGNNDTYSEYCPHITLAYLKKNAGWRLFRNKVFSGHQFNCDQLKLVTPKD